jgi:uncharacterized membrane protein YsdA (DUF1294 family)
VAVVGSILGAVPLPALVAWLVVVNVVTAVAYASDKMSARRGGRRIRERTLLLLDMLGGVVGAWIVFLGMRHKTLHRRFWVVQAIATVLGSAIVVGVLLA